ncbi:uncharacterized protein LOC129632100 [Bubalus kerabau]|uniref:uncharacterized protein LOC129632100 n=1 Tax=Bubalus carabanensis TaxID=3119969 RepID=UPI00244EC1D0|nr:uncharacterized protein LOC129632100 [Bubalus carabanensis]
MVSGHAPYTGARRGPGTGHAAHEVATREARSPPAVQRPCAGSVLSVAEPLRARRELEAAQLYGCPGLSLTAPCSLLKAAFFRCSVSLRLAQEALCGDDGVWAAGTGRSARPSTAPRLRGTFWVRWPEAAVSNFLWSQKSWKAKKKVAVITANNLVSRTDKTSHFRLLGLCRRWASLRFPQFGRVTQPGTSRRVVTEHQAEVPVLQKLPTGGLSYTWFDDHVQNLKKFMT